MTERKQYAYTTPYVPGRPNVREPVPDRLVVPLHELNMWRQGGDYFTAELRLTVPQALELAAMLINTTQDFCKRGDIRAALRNTSPGPVNDALGLTP